jgi:RNA polymerase sigma factor (sigma-70 family)
MFGERERRHAMRVCTAIAGPDHAEDLAQETLLEAWRHRDKLTDPVGADRWLAAIARNVCRRHARRRGREAALLAALRPQAEAYEADLDRDELVELLDRALAALRPAERDVLVRHYVDQMPHREIAAAMGISADAVSMRISRGRLSMRRLLQPELEQPVWRSTALWCPGCGDRRLRLRRTEKVIVFRCDGCDTASGAVSAEYALSNPVFAGQLGSLVRPSAIVARAAAWTYDYYAAGAGANRCTRCAAPVRLQTFQRIEIDERAPERRGLYADCGRCGEEVCSSLGGIALAQPAVRALRRRQARLRPAPVRRTDHGGVPALQVRYEAVGVPDGVDVVFERDTLRVLSVNG